MQKPVTVGRCNQHNDDRNLFKMTLIPKEKKNSNLSVGI